MNRNSRSFLGMALVLGARPVFAQMRLEVPAPRILSAPAISLSLPMSAALVAPSLAAPALSFAPALSAGAVLAPAAAEGPVQPSNAELTAVSRAAAPSGEAQLPERSLNTFWDGLGIPAQDDATVYAPPDEDGLLPEAAGSAAKRSSAAPWLALKDKKYAAALDAAVRLARGTKAGRRAFDAAQKALGDGALPLEVKDLGKNHGEYNYLKGRLSLSSKMFLPGREAELAGTLAHELLHVAQHAQGLPSNALELELEAHLLDLELLAELGVKPPKDTFARQAYEALRQGPKQFAALIAMAVPGSPYLGDSSFAEIADQLEAELDSMEDRRGPKAALLAKVIEADLKLIKSARGRRTYQAFSDRVLARLKARAAAAR